MALDKKGKAVLRTQFAEKFEKANAAIVAEYRGLTVAELTTLRRSLKQAGADFKVTKNRVAKKALENIEKIKPITQHLKGAVGVVLIYGDAAKAAKALVDFQKDAPEGKFTVTGGVMESKAVSAADLAAIASLPSKEVLLGQLLGLLKSPHRGIVTVLSGVPRNVVQVINAIKEKKA
jgi:large subunit ribosomal protein L10